MSAAADVWAEVSEQIDWEAVGAAHRSVKLPEHDYKALALMTSRAAARWVPGDLGKIGDVEQRFLVTVPEHEDQQVTHYCRATKDLEVELQCSGVSMFKGFVDLTLDDPAENANEDVLTVVDWKTTSDVGPQWRERLQHSWQAKLYCWAHSAQRFVFRGVERNGRTAEVVIEWPIYNEFGRLAFCDADAENHVRQAFATRAAQSRSNHWTMHTPWACRAYGRQCEHYGHCTNNTAPRGPGPTGPLSYSSIETLLLCPERYRLDALLVQESSEDDRTALGSAFHQGMAELYGQLKRLNQCR